MNIEQIKANYTCLDWLGQALKKTSAGWYVYRCPWREDSHPSLNVSPDGKLWKDLGTGDGGGIIELLQACFNTKDFKVICAAFSSSSFSMSKTIAIKKKKESKSTTFYCFKLVPLQAHGLYAYLTKRSINLKIAVQFLQEAHYSFFDQPDGKYLYALAYHNDKGGYELRSDAFKGGTSPKGITTHLGRKNAPVVVFEGFMDMLSFATLCGEVRHNYIVLNSIVNISAAIEVLKHQDTKTYLCLDNDNAGNQATMKMMHHLPSAIDIRDHYAHFKDVNEYLVSLKK